jgi:hypothetical protein
MEKKYGCTDGQIICFLIDMNDFLVYITAYNLELLVVPEIVKRRNPNFFFIFVIVNKQYGSVS